MPEHQQIQQSKKTNTIFQKQPTPIIQTPSSNPYSIIQRARINPKSLTHADVMQLQRTIGNRAVAQLLSGIVNSSTVHETPIQRSEIPEEEEKPMQGKFEAVQRSENPEEEEPLQGKMVGTVQRQEIPEEEPPMQGKFESIQRQEAPEDEEPLQGKFEDKPEIACPSCFAASIQRQELEDEEKTLQGKTIETIQRQEIPEEEPLQGKMAEAIQRQEIPEEEPLQTKRENNTGMPDNLKAGVESLSGIDMSDVRVHYNSSKPAKVGALAYTQGQEIHVAPGQEKHLPHEGWHVVQQAQGRVRPTGEVGGMPLNDSRTLESEADSMGQKAVQMYAQVEKSKENKSRAVANSVAQKKTNESGRARKFIDNRPTSNLTDSMQRMKYEPPKIADNETKEQQNDMGSKQLNADFGKTGILQRLIISVEGIDDRRQIITQAANDWAKSDDYKGHQILKQQPGKIDLSQVMIGKSEELLILGHGEERGYGIVGNKFAGYKATALAGIVVAILPLNYNGKIYLDGCYTDQKSNSPFAFFTDHKSYKDDFEDELKRLREDLMNCTVKGNKGSAETVGTTSSQDERPQYRLRQRGGSSKRTQVDEVLFDSQGKNLHNE